MLFMLAKIPVSGFGLVRFQKLRIHKKKKKKKPLKNLKHTFKDN